MPIKSYQDLEVWQRGMDLAEMAYKLTANFPKEEMFGMTSQIRRAATSIPANIAEGWGRNSTAEFQHYLRIAQGSLRELETHLLLAVRIKLTSTAQYMLDEASLLGRQLIALQRSLTAKKIS